MKGMFSWPNRPAKNMISWKNGSTNGKVVLFPSYNQYPLLYESAPPGPENIMIII